MNTLTPDQTTYLEGRERDSLQPSLLVSSIIGLVIASTAVALRFHARGKSQAKFGRDDVLILSALVSLTGYAIAGFCTISFGEGKHILFVSNLAGFVQGYIAAVTGYAITVIFTKISILCFYCRIFRSRILVRMSWVLGTFVVLYNTATVLVASLQCIPLSSLWTGKPGHCIHTVMPFTILGVVNVVSDFVILAIPIRFVMSLNMDPLRKAQVCGIFLLGGLVCVFGIVRVVALARAPHGDPSYNQVWSGVWSFCEVSVGIVAACLPTMGALFNMSHFNTFTKFVRRCSYSFRKVRNHTSTVSSSSTTRNTLSEIPRSHLQIQMSTNSSNSGKKDRAKEDMNPLIARRERERDDQSSSAKEARHTVDDLQQRAG